MASPLTLQINRAPVLTLWGVVVAERLGHSHEAPDAREVMAIGELTY